MNCQRLEWDSQFFGYTIGRLDATEFTPADVPSVETWARDQRIACLYFRAPADDYLSITTALNHGFQLMDVYLTLKHTLTKLPTPAHPYRAANTTDIPRLRSIAARSFSSTRYYRDTHFARELCDALYATWIDNSIQGFADVVLVDSQHAAPNGFITGHLEEEYGRIGLIAVDKAARGQKVGQALVCAALQWFHAQNASYVTVATQGSNIGAQIMYQRTGFISHMTQLTFHRWFEAHL